MTTEQILMVVVLWLYFWGGMVMAVLGLFATKGRKYSTKAWLVIAIFWFVLAPFIFLRAD